MRKQIVALLFVFMGAGALYAQDKFEYATIYYGAYQKPFIGLSIEGVYTERNLDKDEIKGKFWYYDLVPALKEIKDLQNKGYEVFTVAGAPSTAGGGYTIFMRKKIN